MNKTIKDYLPETEILAQLAEEAAELAQAALKLRRALDGTNPTPMSAKEAKASLIEECADVTVCVDMLLNMEDWGAVNGMISFKLNRWLGRLEAAQCQSIK